MSKRIIEDVPVWKNAHKEQPPTGSTILALSRGGVLCSVQWSSKSINFYDGWLSYPRVSSEIKAIQQARWTPEEFKGETNGNN